MPTTGGADGGDVALFKPYDQRGKPAPTEATPSKPVAATDATSPSKGRAKKAIATPTRKQAENAHRARIQPVLTRKERSNKNREARYKARDEAMAKVHGRPYNAMLRDWVDRRWNLAEFMLPVMLIILVITMVGAYWWAMAMVISMYLIYGLVVVLLLDVAFMWIGARRNLKKYFPDEPLKGKMGYVISRSMLMRRSRVPAPRVKRGEPFQWPYKGPQQ